MSTTSSDNVDVDEGADGVCGAQGEMSMSSSSLLRMAELEERIAQLEETVVKKYPEVKFLTYQDRKRILVRGPLANLKYF